MLVGGALQFAVQVPAVASLVPRLRGQPAAAPARRARGGPAGSARPWRGRGVVTLSSYVDVILASLLATGAVAYLDRAQVLYLMPISVFAVLGGRRRTSPRWPREHDSVERMHERLVVGRGQGAAVPGVRAGGVRRDRAAHRGARSTSGVNFTADDTYVVWLVLAGLQPRHRGGRAVAPAAEHVLRRRRREGAPARIAAGRLVFAAIGGLILMIQLDRVGV